MIDYTTFWLFLKSRSHSSIIALVVPGAEARALWKLAPQKCDGITFKLGGDLTSLDNDVIARLLTSNFYIWSICGGHKSERRSRKIVVNSALLTN